MRRSASPTRRKWGCLIGASVSGVALLTGFGFAARDLLQRTSPEPPRHSLKTLPETKPDGVDVWDPKAAALLEENEQVLQAAKTLSAELFYRRGHQRLFLARPNLMRHESQLFGQKTVTLSDGWLLWSQWPEAYDAGFVFPDGRELETYPFSGFFLTKKPTPSFAERVRSAIAKKQLRGLSVTALPHGAHRIQLDWHDDPKRSRWSSTLLLSLDARALPTLVETHALREGQPFRGGWLPVPQIGWTIRRSVLEVTRVELDGPIPPKTFTMVLPQGSKAAKGGNLERFSPVFRGFSTIRGDGLLP